MGKTVSERQNAYIKNQKAKGLNRKVFWINPEEKEEINKLLEKLRVKKNG